MDDITVPAPRGEWTTSALCAEMARDGSITPDSARRWLTRWVRAHPEHGPVGRQPGRTGENLYTDTAAEAVFAAHS